MSNPHSLLAHPISFAVPQRLTPISSWHEHIPFAFALVAAARPGVLVELGTHRGDSYCAFCQAVEGMALPTRCYAVDTWQGDEHAGRYGEEVFEELRVYHDARYGRFSRLIRSTFDEARDHFPDGSIDLLHIDGLHTEKAVSYDFETWKPKLSDRAVVLFHDINVRERGFQVWRYWEELSARHPSFAFVHGHGLGVAALGKKAPAEVLELCKLPEPERGVIRDRFSALGARIGLIGRADVAERKASEAGEALARSERAHAELDARVATVREELARRDERIQDLEQRVAQATGELALRRDREQALRQQLGESERRLAEAQALSRGFQDRLQLTEGALHGLRQEVQRLGAAVAEARSNFVQRLVGWIREVNRARLARRKARRARRSLANLPGRRGAGTSPLLDRGPIGWIRRKNSARIDRRRARKRAALAALPRLVPPGPIPMPVESARPGQAVAAPALGLIPASDELAWSAYPRLREEFRRLRAARHATFEATPCNLIEAPEDLAAFARSLALPDVAAPRVSIVIPAFNHVRETLECIASVAAHTPSNDYEVLVVDDCSSDETQTLLPQIGNVRFSRNATSGGFIVSSSRGAQEARGEFLVFLNNDAQVTANWLPPLLETFSTFDRVGAAGPKVIHPSGRLQEAGAMIHPDLSITMVGLDDDPAKARYNYAREVHYCSGACLVVPRRRFEEVGGFAEDLKPAYYEYCDLQLKLRTIGLRTIYQPASVVAHRRSRTSEGLPDPKGSETRQMARNSQRMRERWGDVVDAMHAVRLIAFYLPQFHPFRENEFWWGKGFTEWTNVAKALPCFVGHEQPHLPTDLGFYDLRIPAVMHEQARLAQAYGISGFCYYYYWFNGKRLLEEPIERLLQESPAAIPFCLCWANENWTRRWDGGGGESEILMGQAHCDEDDEAVILDLIRYLRHPSYIRVNGKPMLLVYRVGLFPDIRRTATQWREACRREGIGEIHLVRVDSFEDASRATHPAEHGFDAATEFPPHQCDARLPTSPRFVREGFRGAVRDYEAAALESAGYKEAGYLHYRAVFPRWDNTPRRQDGATIFANSSPGAYQAYFEEVLSYTREQNVGDDRIVFVNAWNEWAEGAHLEPDRRYGRTYLEATLNALAAHLVDGGA